MANFPVLFPFPWVFLVPIPTSQNHARVGDAWTGTISNLGRRDGKRQGRVTSFCQLCPLSRCLCSSGRGTGWAHQVLSASQTSIPVLFFLRALLPEVKSLWPVSLCLGTQLHMWPCWNVDQSAVPHFLKKISGSECTCEPPYSIFPAVQHLLHL